MADPDEALIEAVAEEVRHEVRGATIGWPRESVDLFVQPIARAAYAAMVAHLGLTVQYGTDDAGDDHEWATEQSDEGSARRITADDSGLVVVRRLVSRWTEVDHGSE